MKKNFKLIKQFEINGFKSHEGLFVGTLLASVDESFDDIYLEKWLCPENRR